MTSDPWFSKSQRNLDFRAPCTAGSSTSVASLVTVLIAKTLAAHTAAEKHPKPLEGMSWAAVCAGAVPPWYWNWPVSLIQDIHRCSSAFTCGPSIETLWDALEFYYGVFGDNTHPCTQQVLLFYLNALYSQHTLKPLSQPPHTTAKSRPMSELTDAVT